MISSDFSWRFYWLQEYSSDLMWIRIEWLQIFQENSRDFRWIQVPSEEWKWLEVILSNFRHFRYIRRLQDISLQVYIWVKKAKGKYSNKGRRILKRTNTTKFGSKHFYFRWFLGSAYIVPKMFKLVFDNGISTINKILY